MNPAPAPSRFQLFLPFGLFCCLAGAGVREFFVGDEVMNLFNYLQHPASWWFPGLLKFWSSEYYRPLGGVAHVAIYHAFGFHPLPFKIVLLAALLLNLALYYRVSIVLSGSRQIASWALLLCSYHAAFAGLYLNFGTIYDVLGYSCYLGALAAYALWVCTGRRPVAGLAAVALVYIAGLEFKEIVVTLPGVLLAYNLLLTRCVQTERLHWPIRSGLPIILCAVAGAFYTFGKMSGPNTIATNAAYTPHFTLHQFASTNANYIRQLFYLPATFPGPTLALWILAVMIAAGIVFHSRLMIFSAVSIVLSSLPVAFIAPRGAFAIYIPFAFWGLYAATVLRAIASFAGSRRRVLAIWLTAACGLAIVHFRMKRTYDPPYTNQAAIYEAFSRQLDNWDVRIPREGRILLINDPFHPDWIGWDPLFIVTLQSHQPGAVLNRLKSSTFLPSDFELATYDYVIDYDSRWQLLKQPGGQLLPSAHLREMSASIPVQLGEGFGFPVQGLWRETAPEFTIRVRGTLEKHSLMVSLVSYTPARLSVQRDDEAAIPEPECPGPNIDLVLPVPSLPVAAEHVFRFRAATHASPLYFAGARLQ